MKETQIKSADFEIVQKKRERKEYKLIGSIEPRIDGGKIFEIDPETNFVSLAVFRETADFVIGESNKRKIDSKKGMVYVEAINKKNAVRRYLKGKILFKT